MKWVYYGYPIGIKFKPNHIVTIVSATARIVFIFINFIFRACLNFVIGIYYGAIFERNEANFVVIVGHYDEKFNEVAAKNLPDGRHGTIRKLLEKF